MHRTTANALVTVAVALLAALAAPCAASAAGPGVLPLPALPAMTRGFGTDPLGSLGPEVTVRLDPQAPDGSYGWYVSPARVWLAAEGATRVRYQWDGTVGRWSAYRSPLTVPEGKHTLYAQAYGPDGAPGPIVAMPLKLSLTTRPLSEYRAFVTRASAPDRQQGAVSVVALVEPPVGPRVVRVWGPDRYGTCQQTALTDWASASTVIVARGDAFPDALAAGGLAGLYDAPILLTPPGAVPGPILRELGRLGATRAIIIGDTHAVSRHAEAQIASEGLAVERLGGVDRYATAALVARTIVARGGRTGAVMIARGDEFPDALALSPFAFRDKRPLLLVRPRELPKATADAIRDLGVTFALVAGGPESVSDAVVAGIQWCGSLTDRRGGSDRYGTAREVARWGAAEGLGDFTFVGIATGERFPDALCGGAAAGHRGGVLLLTTTARLHPLAAAELGAHGPELREVQVFGSEAAVSREAWDIILQIVR